MNEFSCGMTDLYHDWRHALETKSPVAFVAGKPAAGFYRVRDRDEDRSIRWDAVAIWYDDDGVHCSRTGPRPAPTHPDEIEALFAMCNSAPISYELYQSIASGGAWPDSVDPVSAPDPALTPAEALVAEIDALRDQANVWIEKIITVKTQEQADKAANYSEAFAALERRANETHKAQKAPHLEAGRKVDATWKPIAEGAASLKAWAKKAIEPFLIAERQRIVAEERARREEAERKQREAEAARVHAARIGAPPPPAPELAPIPPPPQKAGAGTAGRKVSLRTRTVVEVSDWRAFLTWLASQNDHPDEFRAAVEKQAKRLIDAGMNPPGVSTKEIEVAA